jgi:formylglycine-generating enzyme required for sulfatase activity
MGTTERKKQSMISARVWKDWMERELPAHQVSIIRGFWLGKYELTQHQWESVMGTRPWMDKSSVRENPNHPAVFISWSDMQNFTAKLNQADRSVCYRLPTEAEWEYACRAGTTTLWSFGDDASLADNYAWHRANAWDVGEQYAHTVGTKLPSLWGLYDMHGNVWEWCQDGYGSADDIGGASCILRGGSYGTSAVAIRSAARCSARTEARYSFIGVRLLRQEP